MKNSLVMSNSGPQSELTICSFTHKHARFLKECSNTWHKTGLPRSGKKVWKMNFFPGQGKVKEFQF